MSMPAEELGRILEKADAVERRSPIPHERSIWSGTIVWTGEHFGCRTDRLMRHGEESTSFWRVRLVNPSQPQEVIWAKPATASSHSRWELMEPDGSVAPPGLWKRPEEEWKEHPNYIPTTYAFLHEALARAEEILRTRDAKKRLGSPR